MMNRNSQHSAIILRISPLGEIHATVDLLTPDRGVVRAIVYGLRSRRGSLRGRVVPFARGTLYLYTDPRREESKVVDFDVHRYAAAMQQDLTAFYHGTLWAEVVWRTLASGDGGEPVFALMSEGLDLLEESATVPARTQLISMILLWRYLAIMGLQPDLRHCERSSRSLAAEETRFYDRRDGALVGEEWVGKAMIELPPGVARLLAASDRYPLTRAAALPVTEATLRATRAFMLAAIQDAVEVPLNTLRTVAGYL
ncbi:MAG: DNA repair protein RecO [Spirochaetaceae bacterium]|nr:MAG: DNA repair protein RecO [Spirochaetaceae bacterium]